MTTLLNLFYRLPLEFIAPSFFLGSLLFLMLRERLGDRRWCRRGIAVILVLWFAAALWITVLSRTTWDGYVTETVPFHSYRKMLATGNEEILRSNFMNVALFVPAGLLTAALLPEHWSRRRLLMTVVIPLALVSFGIEFAQFHWMLGEPEIDDVLHNTLGAVLGAWPIAFRSWLYDPHK